MSDAITTAVVGVTAGTATVPLMTQLGLDPLVMVPALAGCIVAQLFLPPNKKEIWPIVAWTFGSVLFAAIVAPALLPVAAKWWTDAKLPQVTDWALRLLVAGTLGAFAQPIFLIGRKLILGGLSKLNLYREEGAKDAS